MWKLNYFGSFLLYYIALFVYISYKYSALSSAVSSVISYANQLLLCTSRKVTSFRPEFFPFWVSPFSANKTPPVLYKRASLFLQPSLKHLLIKWPNCPSKLLTPSSISPMEPCWFLVWLLPISN